MYEAYIKTKLNISQSLYRLKAPQGSYAKILKDDDWKCYLCKPDPDENCLIRSIIEIKDKDIQQDNTWKPSFQEICLHRNKIR
ncbi:hypothetical protein CEXT_242391 [Caerostris extrusa]|uniref:Uncharacterized protein n=1 Tax=Caerostris extrusa TaxID=172846 RepID=A0AAV4WTV8_CAEEX|nr:hypothetical protein CEXT_242391 [Caerostris extrusa]